MLEGYFCIEGLALWLRVRVELFCDLVDVDTNVLDLGAKAGELFHYVVQSLIPGKDPDGAVGQDGTDQVAHVVAGVLVQQPAEFSIGLVVDLGSNQVGEDFWAVLTTGHIGYNILWYDYAAKFSAKKVQVNMSTSCRAQQDAPSPCIGFAALRA
jgi:hypothetical protein